MVGLLPGALFCVLRLAQWIRTLVLCAGLGLLGQACAGTKGVRSFSFKQLGSPVSSVEDLFLNRNKSLGILYLVGSKRWPALFDPDACVVSLFSDGIWERRMNTSFRVSFSFLVAVACGCNKPCYHVEGGKSCGLDLACHVSWSGCGVFLNFVM